MIAMRKAVRQSLKDAASRFFDRRDDVLSFKDPEDLHLMRVSGRTLLSFFNVIGDPDDEKVRRPLKKAMKALGAVRDIDVLIEEMEKRMESMPPRHAKLVEVWLEHKKRERESLRAELAKDLPRRVSRKWRRRMKKWRASEAPALVDKAAMRENVEGLRQAMDASMEAIRSYPSRDMSEEPFLDMLHGARIDVKRLRYSLNILMRFSGADEAEVEALKKMQDRLGRIQDLRVWISQLQGYFDDSNPDVADLVACWRQEMIEALNETGLMVNIDKS